MLLIRFRPIKIKLYKKKKPIKINITPKKNQYEGHAIYLPFYIVILNYPELSTQQNTKSIYPTLPNHIYKTIETNII